MNMKYINDWVLLVFWSALGLSGLFFIFYVASIVLPLLILVVAVSGLVNLGFSVYKKKHPDIRFHKKIYKNNSTQDKIIDAEYEVIDEK